MWKPNIGFVKPGCPSPKKNSALTGRIFMKYDISRIFEKKNEKIKFLLKSRKNN
jgi:hypothetical protein